MQDTKKYKNMKHLMKFNGINEGLFSKKDDPIIKSLISRIKSTFNIENLKQKPGVLGTDYQYTIDDTIVTIDTSVLSLNVNGSYLKCKMIYVEELYDFFEYAKNNVNVVPKKQPEWEPVRKTPNVPAPAVNKPEKLNTKDPVKSHSDYQAYDNFKYKKKI